MYRDSVYRITVGVTADSFFLSVSLSTTRAHFSTPRAAPRRPRVRWRESRARFRREDQKGREKPSESVRLGKRKETFQPRRSYDAGGGHINRSGRKCESRKSGSEIRRLAFVGAALSPRTYKCAGGRREKIERKRARERKREGTGLKNKKSSRDERDSRGYRE